MPAARSGTSRSPFFDGGDELAAERRDVLHHTPPHDGAVAKGRLVHPGCAGVHQVVLDAEAPGRLVPADDAGGDAHPPGTTTASKSSADTSFAATSLVASSACFPRTVWPPAVPTTVTSAASSRRRMSVTQNSRSSNPSARSTATLRPDKRVPSAMMASPPPFETTARARQVGRLRFELSRFGRAGKGQGGRVPTDGSRHAVEVSRPHLGLVACGRVALRSELELPVLELDVRGHPG